MDRFGNLDPRELAREIARRLPSFHPLEEDPKRRVQILDEWDSPWDDPVVRRSLHALGHPQVIAEVLREVANAIDPPQKRPGPHVSAIEVQRRGDAELRLRIARLQLHIARRRSADAPRRTRAREALALRLDANETAAVLAFASVTDFSGPLAKVDVDEALRYFDAARKGTKPRSFVPRKPKPKGGPCGPKEGPKCRDRERPTAPAEPASPPTSRRSSSAGPSSLGRSASPKDSSDSRKPAATGRRRSASGIASSSTSSRPSSNGSAATRARPKGRRRKEPPDGS